MPYAKNSTLYAEDIKKVINLKPGEFHIIDAKVMHSFRATLRCWIVRFPFEEPTQIRHLQVSKDKAYFFKINLKLKIT